MCGEGSMFKISASSFPGSWESLSPRIGEDLRGLLKRIWHSAELAVNTWGNPNPNSTLYHPKLSCMSELIDNFMFLDVNSSSSCCNSLNLPAKHLMPNPDVNSLKTMPDSAFCAREVSPWAEHAPWPIKASQGRLK